METKILKKENLNEVVELIQKGEVVAFPTDTVYGLGIKFNDADSFMKMKLAKGRPDNKPFPLMVSDAEQMDQVAYLNDEILKIVHHFTPGALTLVLKKKELISSQFTAGMDTIAIRIPDDEFVLKLLKQAGPMFVTSANLSDHPSCKNTDEVLDQLNGRIAAVVQGEAGSYVSSTIIDCSHEEIKVLREGNLTLDTIQEYLKK